MCLMGRTEVGRNRMSYGGQYIHDRLVKEDRYSSGRIASIKIWIIGKQDLFDPGNADW